jgi:hypothetical protein
VATLKALNGLAAASLKTRGSLARANWKSWNGLLTPSTTNVDPYWANVVLLAGNESGADGTTAFTDQSASAHVITALGNSQWDDAQKPTGLASTMLFDAVGDGLTLADHANWHVAAADWTVECLVRFNSLTNNFQPFVTNLSFTTGAGGWGMYRDGTLLHFYYTTGGTVATRRDITGTWSPVVNTWYHVAACRNGANLRLFVDGVQVGSTFNASTDSIFDSTYGLYIANEQSNADIYRLNGWQGSTRVTKAFARYTANFTTPALPFPTTSGNTYAAWNPSDKGSAVTLSNGDKTAAFASSTNVMVRSTVSKSAGKWYWEVTAGTASSFQITVGIAKSTATLNNYLGQDANGWSYYGANGNKINAATQLGYGATFAAGDVIGVKLDLDAGTIEFLKNNVSQGTAYSSLSGTFFAAVSGAASGTQQCTANFGETAFVYPVPSGYNRGLYA